VCFVIDEKKQLSEREVINLGD